MFTFVNLWNLSDKSLFDDIELPTGKYNATNPDGTQVEKTITPDKEILVNSILDEVAELQPITIDVDVMKMKINNFFLKNKEGFNRLIAINILEYSPIENTDKYETRTNKYDSNIKNETTETAGDTDTLEHDVASFNSSSLNIASKDIRSNTANLTNNNARTADDTTTETIRAHGNIGVTTNQQMMEQEVNFWTSFSFYKIVATKFMFDLCLTIETY